MKRRARNRRQSTGLPRHIAPGRQPDQWPARDEPEIDFEDEEWIEWGGVRIWAVGETSGGAPYGLTYEEYRRAIYESDRDRGWARARRALERLLRCRVAAAADVEIGRVRFLGDGISSATFIAAVEIFPDVDGLSGAYVIRLPRRDAPGGRARDDRLRHEAELLRGLCTRPLPFRVPEVLGLVPDGKHLVMVERAIDGVPMDHRSGRQPGVRPWRVVGEVAAATHRIDPAGLPPAFDGGATWREHLLGRLAPLEEGVEESGDFLVEEVCQWVRSNPPANEPGCLLHGDLTSGNLLLDLAVGPDGLEPGPPGVLDWEFASLGDPAWDLAIATRGVRRPFQLANGFEKLLDAYHDAGGQPISARDVRRCELVLVAGWYQGAQRESSGAASQYGAQLRRLLQLAKRAVTSA